MSNEPPRKIEQPVYLGRACAGVGPECQGAVVSVSACGGESAREETVANRRASAAIPDAARLHTPSAVECRVRRAQL